VRNEGPKTWRYVALVVVVLAAIFVATKILHRPGSAAPDSQTSTESPQENAQNPPAPVVSQPSAPEKKANVPSATSSQPAAAQPSGSSSDSGAPNAAPISKPAPAKASPVAAGQDAVVRKVLPTVSDRARTTIRGTVRVIVKVDVDASGSVTNATIEPAGTSKYFGDLSLQAAHDWKFRTSQPDGQAVPSQWFLTFLYTQTDTTAYPSNTAP
jgi:TonB family protein